MARRYARILFFARRPPSTHCPQVGRRGPRATKPRTPTGGVEMAIPFDLTRLRHTRREREGPERDESSHGSRGGEDTSWAHDTTTPEVLLTLLDREPERLARFERDVRTNVRFLLRGRAGTIVSTVVGRRTGDALALTNLRDLSTYRTIMETWRWAGLVQAVQATRSYEAGLDAALLLLRVTDLHHEHLSQREYEAHRRQLYWFLLELLDRLDRWKSYLAIWEYLRTHTTYSLELQPRAGQSPDARLAPFILRDDACGLTVHFLWLIQYRKEVIGRKVDRQRRGAGLGNLHHATQDALSAAEIRERLQAVVQCVREASHRW